MFKKFIAASAIAIATTGAANALTVTYNFEEFANGEIVTSVVRNGVTADVSAIGGVNAAVICDTDLTPDECDDPDLLDPFDGNEGNFASDSVDSPLGNVLIVQERGRPAGGFFDPADDNARGGELILEFDELVTLLSVTIVDIESNKAIDIFLDAVQLVQSSSALDGVSGNNLFETFVPENTVSGRVLVFDSSTSFAIDNITVSVVPVPAGLPLLLTGIGGLALLRRRMKKKA